MTNTFREVLLVQDIRSGTELADVMDAPAVIFFFANPSKALPHAELWSWDEDGRLTVDKYEPRYSNMSLPAMRRKTVLAAQEDAMERLGIEEWAKSPFDNCWFPKDVLDAARKKYLEPSAD